MDNQHSTKTHLFILTFVYLENKTQKKFLSFDEISACLQKVKADDLNDKNDFSAKEIYEFLKILTLSEYIRVYQNEQKEIFWEANFDRGAYLEHYPRAIKTVFHPYFKQLESFAKKKSSKHS